MNKDMTVREWIRQPNDGDFAKGLRRGIRMHRREKGRGGHRFSFNDLKTLWVSGEDHAIVTHDVDRHWQFWWRHPERGWFLQSWHRILSEAKEEAELPRTIDPPQKPHFPGNYVVAEWKEPFHGENPIMVRCSSEYTLREIKSVFENLGCTTRTKVIG